jgi:hypothetical protein
VDQLVEVIAHHHNPVVGFDGFLQLVRRHLQVIRVQTLILFVGQDESTAQVGQGCPDLGLGAEDAALLLEGFNGRGEVEEDKVPVFLRLP